MLVLVMALCVAGCQFAVGGVPPLPGEPAAGDPIGTPQPQPALDGGATDLAPDAGTVMPPPPPPMPTDCRTTGCPGGETCQQQHKDGTFVCGD